MPEMLLNLLGHSLVFQFDTQSRWRRDRTDMTRRPGEESEVHSLRSLVHTTLINRFVNLILHSCEFTNHNTPVDHLHYYHDPPSCIRIFLMVNERKNKNIQIIVMGITANYQLQMAYFNIHGHEQLPTNPSLLINVIAVELIIRRVQVIPVLG